MMIDGKWRKKENREDPGTQSPQVLTPRDLFPSRRPLLKISRTFPPAQTKHELLRETLTADKVTTS